MKRHKVVQLFCEVIASMWNNAEEDSYKHVQRVKQFQGPLL